ncbi:MAG: radical SAM protein [bacterium]|nr:radical SAM protein [bacterium]
MLPKYLETYKSGLLEEKVKRAHEILSSCTLCPRNCRVNRLKDKKGFCRSGKDLIVSSAVAHFGEEPPISGTSGSGTIFFSNCNLKCIFCQNYQISQLGMGNKVTTEELADMMLSLQNRGSHNINWVSPTHFLPQILEGLYKAIGKGLKIPIVYNTGGYDSLEIIKLLDGIVDIYLPDMKYSDNPTAEKLSSAPDYPQHNQAAIVEMFRQVGNLKVDKSKVAVSGLLIRHLILPDDLAGSYNTLSFLANKISRDVLIGLMSQYHPSHMANKDKRLNRKITGKEYKKIINWAEELGFKNCLIQGMDSSDLFLPDFEKDQPF